MKKKDAKKILHRWFSQIQFRKPIQSIQQLIRYARELKAYSMLDGAENLDLFNSYPQLYDKLLTTPYDPHYVTQSYWALSHLRYINPRIHIDIGSQIQYVVSLASILPVLFVDIRPIANNFPSMKSISGSILYLPFDDASINSISCLHVAEHIGLGRYGDSLDPKGTLKACRELARILAPGGNLFFSLPVGIPRVCFNAHRIHSPTQIIEYFHDLNLREFSAVDDSGCFLQGIPPQTMCDAEYACGLFWFSKDLKR